jgi:N-acetylneuraminic acid mutarotase
MKRILLFSILSLILLIPNSFASSFSLDPWWNSSWIYRRNITINNTQNSNTLTDYQVLVNLDTTSLISAGKMRSDCGDIRVTYYNLTNGSETEIPQWVWTNQSNYSSLSYSWQIFGCNTTNTRITIKVPYIPANSYLTIYIYYGNPNVTSTSSLLSVYSDDIAIMSATLPTGRYGLSCAPYEDSIYCFGGYDGILVNQIVRYNVTSDSITVMSTTLPTGRYGLSCVPYRDSIYCFGGYDGALLNQIVRYNITSDSITVMSATLPSARYEISCTPYADSIYCFGGYDTISGYLNEIVRYNVTSDSITVMSATLPTGRYGLSCAPYEDSIYCFGGFFDGTLVNQIVRYNVTSDSITVMSTTLPTGRTALSCAPYADSIYCFGGYAGAGIFLDQIVRYNVTSDSITVMSATLPTGRNEFSCAPYGDSIYCFGGYDTISGYLNQIVRYAKKYTSPEPTYSIGAEETVPYISVTFSYSSISFGTVNPYSLAPAIDQNLGYLNVSVNATADYQVKAYALDWTGPQTIPASTLYFDTNETYSNLSYNNSIQLSTSYQIIDTYPLTVTTNYHGFWFNVPLAYAGDYNTTITIDYSIL